MGIFHYTAYDKSGTARKGMLEADSERKTRQLLRAQGLVPVEVQLTKKRAHFDWKRIRQRVPVADIAMMTRELATLISSSMPLEQALLATSEEVENKYLQEILLSIRNRVREGYTLAKGLSDYPNVFSQIYISTVKAGEESGHIELVLNHLAEYTEGQHRMRMRIRQALVYPCLMTVVSLGIVIFLLVSVVPKMIDLFRDSGEQLPFLTQILLMLSDFFTAYGWLVLILAIAAFFTSKWLLKKPHVKRRVQNAMLRLPIVGKAIKNVNTARYCQTLGILFGAGVPIVQAMQTAAELVTLIDMQESLKKAAINVQEGSVINQALKNTSYFYPMTIHFIANGESSGRLEEMLTRAANNQQHHVLLLIETTLTVFEPLLILIMGAMVLFIVLATMLPMFEMTQLL